MTLVNKTPASKRRQNERFEFKWFIGLDQSGQNQFDVNHDQAQCL